MEQLDQARCNLLSAFTINALYWILLRLRGLNPKENDLLGNELVRFALYNFIHVFLFARTLALLFALKFFLF